MSDSLDHLAAQALQQRERLHHTADELKAQVALTREKFDLKRNARQYFSRAAIAVSAVGLIFGYGFAGIFTRY